MIQTYSTILTGKQRVSDDVYLFSFQCRDPGEVNFTAGQYLILFVPQPGKLFEPRRLFSIITPPSQKDSFDLLVKILPHGLASQYLIHLKEGSAVKFQGPAGRFILEPRNKPIIFLSTGTGLAPIKSIISTVLPSSPQFSMNLLWGLQHYKSVYLFDELKQIADQYTQFTFTICLSRESSLDHIDDIRKKHFALGRVNVVLDGMLYTNNKDKYDYYVCGGRDAVESLRQYLYTKGIAKESVFFEKF